MARMFCAPQRLTRRRFRDFGRLIDFPRRGRPKDRNLFRIVVRQEVCGWRIAYLIVREKVIDRLERHRASRESFEPVKGRGLLFVADRKDPRRIRCFLLDTPVILDQGVWHGVVTLAGDFDVKIVENLNVTCDYWPLGFRLG